MGNVAAACHIEGCGQATFPDTIRALLTALLEDLGDNIDVVVRSKDCVELLLGCKAEYALGAL